MKAFTLALSLSAGTLLCLGSVFAQDAPQPAGVPQAPEAAPEVVQVGGRKFFAHVRINAQERWLEL